MDLPTVSIDLWRADAIVLFDWLMTIDMDEVPANHRAVKQALTDLLNQLEPAVAYGTSGNGLTEDEIAAAQHEVSKDMGW